jgi:hypothetical protein
MCICVLCLIVVPLTPAETPFAVKLNNEIIIKVIDKIRKCVKGTESFQDLADSSAGAGVKC